LADLGITVDTFAALNDGEANDVSVANNGRISHNLGVPPNNSVVTHVGAVGDKCLTSDPCTFGN
jgi:hypothetical protein